MSRITRAMVADKVEQLNAALCFRNAPYRYKSHSEYDYMVLDKYTVDGGCIESTVRGVGTRELYQIVKTTYDILTDNTFAPIA